MTRWLMLIGLLLIMFPASAFAQPLFEPVLSSDMVMRADRATVVSQQDQSKLLLLEGDVSVTIGGHGFRDQRALVRIKRRQMRGQVVRDFAMVFESPTANGQGGVKADGKGLLVTVANQGQVRVTAELKPSEQLPQNAFTRSSLDRFAEYDQRLSTPRLTVPPQAMLTPEQKAKRESRRKTIQEERRTVKLPDPIEATRTAQLTNQPVLPTKGTLRYGSVDRVVYQRGEEEEEEDAVILIGGVQVIYQDVDAGRDVLLTADRIVIFIDKDDNAIAGTSASIDAGKVRGVYLENNAVVSDNTTTVRAPRAFYDLQTNRAVLLDAVVYSYDMQRRVPLYMRAQVIRQTSADSFSANDATFTTSEFGKPHLSIGASRITLQRITQENGETENWVTADNITLNAGQTPFFYWPTATVDAGNIPLRRIKTGLTGDNGAEVQTRWDVFALMGKRPPKGVSLEADIDLRGEHGLALGLDLEYNQAEASGQTLGYFLPHDSGEDELALRDPVGFDAEARGFIHARHRQVLPAGWEAWFQASYVSDPTFLEEFFPEQAYAEDAYETSAFFKRAEDDWAVTALLSGQTNHVLTQYPTLLTPGYAVSKQPELAYRLITNVFDNRVTLFHESRISRMRAVFSNDSPADRGFTQAQALSAFGIAANTSFDQAAKAKNFPHQFVSRFDSRTELTAPFRTGSIDVSPFAVARLTAYDADFTAFNNATDDQARLWGGIGTRLSTQLTRTAHAAHSTTLDVNGLRHIVAPGVTIAYYDGTMSSTDLPIFDPEVERLGEGAVARLGMVNTWQTKRGGKRQERTIDWVRLRTDIVLVSESSTNPRALGRYYDYRPEYTLGDDHFYTEILWAVTEATAMTGDLTYGLDEASTMQWHLGVDNQHTDRLTTHARYREIDVINARLLSYGAALQLTTKYRASIYQVIDLAQENRSRLVQFSLDRRLPRATFGIHVGYDNIDGEATIAFTLSPQSDTGADNAGFLGRPQ